MGPRHGRAAAPGDRLAGPPHGGALRASCGRPATSGSMRAHTGLVLDSLLLGHEDPVAAGERARWPGERARSGGAMFGTIDSWLIFKLTGEHLTDATNASRTMLYDIAAGRWDPELLDLFGDPRAGACRRCCRAPGAFAARPARRRSHGHEAPVGGCGGRPAGGAVRPGLPSSRAGQEHLRDGLVRAAQHRLHASRASRPACCSHGGLGDRTPRTTYALEASIFVTGARCSGCATACDHRDAGETEALAASLDANDGVYFVPALTGLGSPHWDPQARGHDRGAHARRRARALGHGRRWRRSPTRRWTRCARWSRGGAAARANCAWTAAPRANGWLMQFQADMLGAPVLLGRDGGDAPRFGAACSRAWARALWASGGRARPSGTSAGAMSRG